MSVCFLYIKISMSLERRSFKINDQSVSTQYSAEIDSNSESALLACARFSFVQARNAFDRLYRRAVGKTFVDKKE